MSILKFLGLEPRDGRARREEDTETVRRIVKELDAMQPERARHLAAFAFILSRVANADSHISDAETRDMERTVMRYGGLSQAQAVLVVQIAKSQANLFGATENFLVTRQFKTMTTPEEREELLHCLFAVSAADESISSIEESQIRQIAGELDMSDRDFLAVRASYNDKRQVMKDLPGGQ
jgi:uncharacterized tellurite resistance protein B-like protein